MFVLWVLYPCWFLFVSTLGVGGPLLLIVCSYLGGVLFIVVFSWFTNGCGVHPMSDFFSVCFIKHGVFLFGLLNYILVLCVCGSSVSSNSIGFCNAFGCDYPSRIMLSTYKGSHDKRSHQVETCAQQ